MCETGQIMRQVISIKAKHGPRLRELPKVTVKLTVDAGAEDQEIFRQHGAPGRREVQICRMAEEALEQGGVLTQEDLADILQVDVRTVRRTIKQLQESYIRVQTRGLYHDIGPSISHKAWIVDLYLEYKTYPEIARTTRHTTTSIKRYIMDFARVVLCIQKGLSLAETAHIAGISERLARRIHRSLPALQQPPTHRENTRPDHKSRSGHNTCRTKRGPNNFMKMVHNKENAIKKRTFRSALIEMLEREYKLIGSHKVIALIADDICQLRDEFYPRAGEEAYGNLTWVTTSSDNKKPRLGQRVEDYKNTR